MCLLGAAPCDWLGVVCCRRCLGSWLCNRAALLFKLCHARHATHCPPGPHPATSRVQLCACRSAPRAPPTSGASGQHTMQPRSLRACPLHGTAGGNANGQFCLPLTAGCTTCLASQCQASSCGCWAWERSSDQTAAATTAAARSSHALETSQRKHEFLEPSVCMRVTCGELSSRMQWPENEMRMHERRWQ